MNDSGRRYLIEHWVRSNLRSHNGKPFMFEVDGAKVTVLPVAADQNAEGFTAQTLLDSNALLLAERVADEVLTKLLDVLCYEIRVSGLVMRPVRSQVEDAGSVRRCMVYGHEVRQRFPFLMERNADEVRRIIALELDRAVRRALYWLRWAYNARTLPDTFLFAWMALERLAGEQEVTTRCSRCKTPVACPQHGEHRHSSVPRSSIRALLQRHGVADIKTLLKLRDPLVHGSLEHNFMQRVDMKRAVPQLVHAVEEELRARLNSAEAPVSGPGDVTRLFHCEYRTAFPDDPFPADCPTLAEVEEYKEALRRGHQHPKIMALPELPVRW